MLTDNIVVKLVLFKTKNKESSCTLIVAPLGASFSKANSPKLSPLIHSLTQINWSIDKCSAGGGRIIFETISYFVS